MSDDFDLEDDGNDSKGIANLRKQYKELADQFKAQNAELEKFRATERAASVGKLLEAKGLTAQHAKFYSGDDTSEDAISKWYDENKALFGVQQDSEPSVDPNAAAAARIAAVSNGQPAVVSQPVNGLPAMGDIAAMTELMKTASLEDLVAKGLLPAELAKPRR